MTHTRFALAAVLLLLFTAPFALAGERGMVSASGVELKSEPKPKGKKVDKLKQGTMVDVTDHSPDGSWLKLSVNGQEGWVEKSVVRSLSRYGFSWERKPTKGNTGATSSTTAKTAEPEATPAAEAEGWGTESTTEPEATGWDATPAAAATPAADATPADEGWGDEAASTPDPAAAATPTPEDDGWGEETDLTQ